MKEDLSFVRPRGFKEFWSPRGPVQELPRLLVAGLLPRSTILTGTFGSGKTSLAMLLGQKAGCLKKDQLDPCYECEGCKNADNRLCCWGARFHLYGGDFRFEELQRFCRNCNRYYPPMPYDVWVPIIDELQYIDPKTQERIVHLIDSTDRAHFIFCASNLNGVELAIQKRSQIYAMPVASVEEAARAILRTAEKEHLSVTQDDATRVAREMLCNPRDCLKELHRFKGTGNLSETTNNAARARVLLGS